MTEDKHVDDEVQEAVHHGKGPSDFKKIKKMNGKSGVFVIYHLPSRYLGTIGCSGHLLMSTAPTIIIAIACETF